MQGWALGLGIAPSGNGRGESGCTEGMLGTKQVPVRSDRTGAGRKWRGSSSGCPMKLKNVYPGGWQEGGRG